MHTGLAAYPAASEPPLFLAPNVLTCHGPFPPIATSVSSKEGIDRAAAGSVDRSSSWHGAGRNGPAGRQRDRRHPQLRALINPEGQSLHSNRIGTIRLGGGTAAQRSRAPWSAVRACVLPLTLVQRPLPGRLPGKAANLPGRSGVASFGATMSTVRCLATERCGRPLHRAVWHIGSVPRNAKRRMMFKSAMWITPPRAARVEGHMIQTERNLPASRPHFSVKS